MMRVRHALQFVNCNGAIIIELGCYTSELDAADFGKIPNPELEEIQEIESASFLSFRKVLCYE